MLNNIFNMWYNYTGVIRSFSAAEHQLLNSNLNLKKIIKHKPTSVIQCYGGAAVCHMTRMTPPPPPSKIMNAWRPWAALYVFLATVPSHCFIACYLTCCLVLTNKLHCIKYLEDSTWTYLFLSNKDTSQSRQLNRGVRALSKNSMQVFRQWGLCEQEGF